MDLFDLFCKISIDDSGFVEGIDNVTKRTKNASAKLKDLGTAVKDAAKTFVTIGAGITAAAGTVFAFANGVSQTADHVDKMSQKLGMSAQGYQEWSFILDHCGATIDGLQSGMKTFAGAVESNNDAFERLGITQEEIAAMNNEELFAATITALQNVEDETERTYLAGQLLGRGATELGPVFNMTATETEALREQLHALGGVMSDEAVKNGAAFQDALTDLKTAFSGASNSLAVELIPNLTTMMNSVAKFVADGGLQNLIDGFTNLSPVIAVATAAMVAYKAASAIASVIAALTKATEGQTIAQIALNAVMNANPFVLVATAVAALATGIMALWATNEDFRNVVISIWDSIKSAVTGAVDKVKETIGGLQDAFGGAVDGIKNLLGIHSPSRVFAGIGENMALGLGEGWEDKFSKVKNDITNSLDFGTANVDFAASGLGVSSAGIINSVTNAGMDGGGSPMIVNLTLPDGTNFATWQLPYLIKVAAANGTPIANGQVG